MPLHTELPNGLEALRRELSLAEIMRLIERTARWVNPETYRYLPVWYPEHARHSYFYKGSWSEPQMNRNRETGKVVHKTEGNLFANKTLTSALGLRSDGRQNWSCCHIWGIDDEKYQKRNSIVQDNRFYSCVANMVLLPTPLKAFTDVMPDVKMRLRVCARYLYGWTCDHDDVAELSEQVEKWSDWNSYPESWPKPDAASEPCGLAPFSNEVRIAADRRKAAIRRDLDTAGRYYPKEKVQKCLDYWKNKFENR